VDNREEVSLAIQTDIWIISEDSGGTLVNK
jgi:hypothetical protein